MEGKDSYKYVEETIKKRPVNKQKLVRKTLSTIIGAVIFGFVACLTFLLLEPVISEKLSPEEIKRIELPEIADEIAPEELLTNEQVEQGDMEIEDQLNTQIEEQISSKIQQEIVDEQTAIKTYQAAYDALYSIANEASKKMVVVTGVSKDTDWFLNEVENVNETSGVIIVKSEDALYILADVYGLPDAENFTVTLPDGVIVATQLIRSDKDTGLGIFIVQKKSLSEKQWEEAKAVELSNSRASSIVGRPVVAVGSPLGQSGSLCYGIVTSNKKEIAYADYHYGILTTDIAGSETNSSGIIVNSTGKLIGIITSKSSASASGALLACFGISDVKKLVECLTNDEPSVYLGIHGASVTPQIHNLQNIPYGAYVTEVDANSPAFNVGIGNSDIVVGINGQKIDNVADYMNVLYGLETNDLITIQIKRFDGKEYRDMEVELVTGEK